MSRIISRAFDHLSEFYIVNPARFETLEIAIQMPNVVKTMDVGTPQDSKIHFCLKNFGPDWLSVFLCDSKTVLA